MNVRRRFVPEIRRRSRKSSLMSLEGKTRQLPHVRE
jgi:hypothetical protein